MRSTFRLRLSFICLILLSCLIRFYQIGRQSYWLDEMFSLNVAMAPGLSSVLWDNHPFLYHLILKFWIEFFGTTEVAVRALSALFSVGTTALLGVWGWRKNPWFGLGLAFLHAIHPTSILYAQESRMYSLFELTASFALVSFFDLLEQKENRKKWSQYYLSAILCAGTHYAGLLLIGLHVVLLGLQKERKKLTTLIAGILLFLMLPFFWLLSTLRVQYLEWQKMKFSLEFLGNSLLNLFENLSFHSHWTLFIILISWILIKMRGLDFTQRMKINLTIVFVSIAAVTALSLASQRALLLERYFIFLVPSIIMTVTDLGFFMQKISRWLMPVWLFLLIASSSHSLPSLYTVRKAPWRQFSAAVLATEKPVVLTTRSLAIAYPYFEKASVPIRKLEVSDSGFFQVLKASEEFRTVWIIENYFGALPYFENWKQELKKLGLKAEEIHFQDEQSEVLFAIRIEHLKEITSNDASSER